MKSSEIIVGNEYAAHDFPTSNHRRETPLRRVKVLSTRKHEKKVRYSFDKKRSITYVRIQVMDAKPGSGYGRICSAEEGTDFEVEARYLVTPWTTVLSDHIAAQNAREYRRAALRESLDARFAALLPPDEGETGWNSPYTLGVGSAEPGTINIRLTVRDEHAIKLLELAEKGAKQ